MKPEALLQKSIITYLRSCCPQCLVFAVPNGFIAAPGKNKFAYINHMKATGLLPGVFDMAVYWPGGGHAWIEVKSAKGQLNEAQKVFRKQLADLGVAAFIVRCMDDLFEVIKICKIPCMDMLMQEGYRRKC